MKITSKDLFAQVKKQHETTLAAAFKSGNPEQMAEAMTAFFDGMNEAVLQKAAEEIDARNQDAAILSARGANVLTADERAYYEGLAAALKASDPRAAVANYEVAMPQTVIERIIGTIKKTHPLLDKLNFVSAFLILHSSATSLFAVNRAMVHMIVFTHTRPKSSHVSFSMVLMTIYGSGTVTPLTGTAASSSRRMPVLSSLVRTFSRLVISPCTPPHTYARIQPATYPQPAEYAFSAAQCPCALAFCAGIPAGG